MSTDFLPGPVSFAQPPQGTNPWSKTLNARYNGPVCIQNLLGVTIGQEDCLYLNVYTPKQVSVHRKWLRKLRNT